MHPVLRTTLPKALLAAVIVIVLNLFAWGFDTKLASSSTLPVSAASALEEVSVTPSPTLFEYIEITDSCGPYSEGICVNARSGPGEEYPIVLHLRKGIVLKTDGFVEREGRMWYKIVFDEWLRYPERAHRNLYVAADYVQALLDEGPQVSTRDTPTTTTKWILIDRSSQTLSAYEGEVLFVQEKISTGLEFTPTPRGTFTVYKKTPSRYMQGPIPGISTKFYDLPGVPWNLYFTHQGAVIHGAYWHDHFGEQWSNGCVNLPPERAKILYQWADLGTRVIVQD